MFCPFNNRFLNFVTVATFFMKPKYIVQYILLFKSPPILTNKFSMNKRRYGLVQRTQHPFFAGNTNTKTRQPHESSGKFLSLQEFRQLPNTNDQFTLFHLVTAHTSTLTTWHGLTDKHRHIGVTNVMFDAMFAFDNGSYAFNAFLVNCWITKVLQNNTSCFKSHHSLVTAPRHLPWFDCWLAPATTRLLKPR